MANITETGYTPKEGWRQWARHLSAADRSRLADALGEGTIEPQALVQVLTESEQLASRLSALAPAAADILWQVWAAGGHLPVEGLIRTAATGPALEQLADGGLLIQATYNYYSQYYAYPAEAHCSIRDRIAAPRLAKRAVGSRAPAVSPLGANPVWLTDVFRILSQVRWHGARLTQQGLLYKRWEQSAMQLLTGEHPRPAPERLASAINLANFLGLLAADPAHMTLHATAAAPTFFAEPPERRWRRWATFIQEALAAMALGPLVLDSLDTLPPGRALTAEMLADIAAAHRQQPAVRNHYVELVRAVFHAGASWGWLSVQQGRAQLSGIARAVRAGQFEPEAAPRAIMEPTGDIMVPKETPLGLLWEAEAVLTLHRADVVWIYRCDTAARERAHDFDLSADDILDRIAALLTTELPENVADDIRDGYHRNLAIRVLNAAVVTVRDPSAMPALKKALGPLVVEQLGDRVLLAAPGTGPKLLSRIQKAGLTSRKAVEEAGSELVPGDLVPTPPRPPAPPRMTHQVALPSGSATQLVELVVRGAWGTGQPVRLHYRDGRAPSGPGATIQLVVHQLDRHTVRGLRTDVTPPQWITVPLEAIDQAELS